MPSTAFAARTQTPWERSRQVCGLDSRDFASLSERHTPAALTAPGGQTPLAATQRAHCGSWPNIINSTGVSLCSTKVHLPISLGEYSD
jgi:hypothetical protein